MVVFNFLIHLLYSNRGSPFTPLNWKGISRGGYVLYSTGRREGYEHGCVYGDRNGEERKIVFIYHYLNHISEDSAHISMIPYLVSYKLQLLVSIGNICMSSMFCSIHVQKTNSHQVLVPSTFFLAQSSCSICVTRKKWKH